jgi:hypothetical protein
VFADEGIETPHFQVPVQARLNDFAALLSQAQMTFRAMSRTCRPVSKDNDLAGAYHDIDVRDRRGHEWRAEVGAEERDRRAPLSAADYLTGKPGRWPCGVESSSRIRF